MRATVGRCNALQALTGPKACALPCGTTTGKYKITADLLALLLHHGMIQELSLTPRARKKHRIVFVYTITDKGRAWVAGVPTLNNNQGTV